MVDSFENRDFRRMSVTCVIKFKAAGDKQWHDGKVQDLSATGVSFSCEVPPEAGERVEVDIAPGKTMIAPFAASVEVIRVDPGDVAGEFRVACKTVKIHSLPSGKSE